MPGFRRARRRADGPEDYIEKVREGKLRDPVIGFQFANGFAPIGVLADYLPDDQASCGFAAHMVWRNPYVDPNEPPSFRVPRDVESVRSEEHTSELQSLMRISYAVFCLKKKKQQIRNNSYTSFRCK